MSTATAQGGLYLSAFKAGFPKLHPRALMGNAVIFVTAVTAALTTLLSLRDLALGAEGWGVSLQIAFWLWTCVLFANFAEGRGKARADSLRATKAETMVKLLAHEDDPAPREVPSSSLRAGQLVRVAAGDLIPTDAEVIRGVASVGESAITGESAPVIRESGGTRIVSDELILRIVAEPGKSFLDRMIAMVEWAERQKTPNEIALNILLAGLTLIFLFVVVTLDPFARYSGIVIPVITLAALFVTLIPTTIGGLLSAIGIAGMDRLVRANVIAKSGRAVEAAGDVDTLLLDKTGTITFGNRMADGFFPAHGIPESRPGEAAFLASLSDETPEGKSVVELAAKLFRGLDPVWARGGEAFAFSAQTRLSGIDLSSGRKLRKGAVDAVERFTGTQADPTLRAKVEEIARSGGTPLLVAQDARSSARSTSRT